MSNIIINRLLAYDLAIINTRLCRLSETYSELLRILPIIDFVDSDQLTNLRWRLPELLEFMISENIIDNNTKQSLLNQINSTIEDYYLALLIIHKNLEKW